MFNGTGGIPGNGLGGQSLHGVPVTIEPMTEWQIESIGFDGVEKYITPEGFSDFVKKGAMKVDWRKMVESNGTFDDLSATGVEEEEVEKPQLEMADRKVPEAGIWHEEAKHLHECLQQINVMSDFLKVLKVQQYVEPVTVQEEHRDESANNTIIQNSRQFHWVARRKALTEAFNVIEKAQKFRNVGAKSDADKEQFFRELRELREHWRIKKVGGMILGDIGYGIFGLKYNQSDLFNIWRKRTTNDGSLYGKSALQVKVPCDLMCRIRVVVSIVEDSPHANLFDSTCEESNYMEMDHTKTPKVHWKKALQWAQESLISRDIFGKLFGDAILLHQRICSVKKNTILVSLFDNLVLKIQKEHYKFEDVELPKSGITYLNKSLRQLFLAQLCRRPMRSPSFAYLPLTVLNQFMDMRGPLALDRHEMDFRTREEKSLLDKLISGSSHYVLMGRIAQILNEYTVKMKDPNLSWKLSWASSSHSLLALSFSLRNYEQCQKKSFFIKIEGESIKVLTKEQQYLDCRRDPQLLLQNIDLMYSTYMVNSLAILCRLWNWQVLHSNLNAVDSDHKSAPTFYAVNRTARAALFVQFRPGCQPPVFKLRVSRDGLDKPAPYVKLDYEKLPGITTMKKAENLFGALRD
ncbi:hypothetical protein L596_015258 [Steinernema carpocapsae]|uniref:Mediator of RNA polymerase II transcription subunit 17 n=1 Tax=Steinernema carpocapsae TaxID=34508 RepID=A0A4U5NFR4_STECR|nr:hypothetical protein L596_015258 [Steinernema carpocapsae]